MSPVYKLKRPPIDIDAAKNDPEVWRTVGDRLLRSARQVWPPLEEALIRYRESANNPQERRRLQEQADHFGAFFMLAGLAVENHLKARILQRCLNRGEQFATLKELMSAFKYREPNYDDAGAPLPPAAFKDGGLHNSVQLALTAGLRPTSATDALLESLSIYVLWAGRYPVPKDDNAKLLERVTRSADLTDIVRFIGSLPR
jgi:hypothetical protein